MKKLSYLLFIVAVSIAFVGCRKPVEVSFDTTTQEVDAQGGSIEVVLKSNGDWTINSPAEWVTVSPMSGKGDATLTLTIEANTSGEDRATQIKATTITATIIIYKIIITIYIDVYSIALYYLTIRKIII